MAGVADNF